MLSKAKKNSPYFEKFLFSLSQFLSGEKILDYMAELEKTQWLSPEELQQLQQAKLKRLLEHAYQNVPYYQVKFKELGILPEKIKDLEAWGKIPLLEKKVVRDDYTSLCSKHRHERWSAHRTSGSTGTPVTVFWNSSGHAFNMAMMYRCRSWHELDVGTREIRVWGEPLTIKGKIISKLKGFFLSRRDLSILKMSEENINLLFAQCRSFRPDFLYGYATALYEFAELIKKENLEGHGLGFKVVISTSEILHDYQKQLIESVFRCKVINEYGSGDAGLIAFECPAGNLHLQADGVLIEFLKDGKPVSAGQMGEITITPLHNYAMPLIRYKIGDCGILSDKVCSCGRGLPVMELKIAKEVELIHTLSGKTFTGEIFDNINQALNDKRWIKQFRVTQKSIKDFEVEIVRGEVFSENYLEIFRKEMIKVLGPEIKVTFTFVPQIKREPSGKLKYFVSELASGSSEKG
ncbi:phenylacetate--CoA ligase family protein [Candidatus Omnitrophota bacterium]